MTIKLLHPWLWISVCSVLLICGCERHQDSRVHDYPSLNPQKDFVLTDQDGKPFHLKDHRGEVVFLFFGYLSCPDICPTTISKLTRVYALLGDQKSKVLTLFVSVDPQRDNPGRLKEYLSYFNIKAIGLTGTKEEIDQVVKAYAATYEKVETESKAGYLFNHTDYVYILDPNGMVRYLVRPEDKPDKIAGVVKGILK